MDIFNSKYEAVQFYFCYNQEGLEERIFLFATVFYTNLPRALETWLVHATS